MSLLDDARRLVEKLDRQGDGPWVNGGRYEMLCLACDADIRIGPHADDCPWPSMPKIVKALEAAERYVSLNGRDDVPMTDIMHAEDDLHEAFGHARRYDVEEITP